jgi:hypothetical protein
MSTSANVLSIDAVKDFHAAMCQFCEDARDALGSIDLETRRVREWLTHEQMGYWRRELLDRQDEVQQAKAALFRKQLGAISGREPDLLEEKDAVRAAQRRVEEAEDKIELCRRWERQVQRALEEYEPAASQLAALVEGQPPRCVVHLDQVIAALEAYVAAGGVASPPAGG